MVNCSTISITADMAPGQIHIWYIPPAYPTATWTIFAALTEQLTNVNI